MSVYTRRIVGPRFMPSGATTVYEVPAGSAVVLRSITLVNSHPTAAGLVRSGIDGTSFDRLILRTPIPALTAQYFDVRIAMAAGEDLITLCDLPSHVAISITGYVLSV